MRYGVLSDVHGNLHALRSALAVMRAAHVDGYLCLGDLIGYGPLPNECVELVASIGAVCVAGNHELMALGRLGQEEASDFARDSLSWTRGVLTEATWTYIASLPATTSVSGAVLAHGSLDDPAEYVTSPGRAREQLAGLQHEPEPWTLLLGHTHHAWAFAASAGALLHRAPGGVPLARDERYLLNPGSVGQSRDRLPECRFLVLDLDAGRADFQSIPYDLDGCRDALRRHGRPADSCHRRPRPLLEAGRTAVDLGRRTAKRLGR